MKVESDEDLYKDLAGSNKEAAFRRLYDRYSGPLFRFIYRFTVNTQAAEEILHDIYIELLSQKFTPSADSTLKGWLFTLAKHKSLNHLRKKTREITDESILEKTPDNNDLEHKFIHDKLLHKLTQLEATLPIDLKEPWQLRKQGLDYQQIAEQLSIPVGTVKSRFSRLVDYLKKEFQL